MSKSPSATHAHPDRRWKSLDSEAPIWWSNATFFFMMHAVALYAVIYVSPFSSTPKRSLFLAFALWQLSCFGITIGYHRLYSHRSFRATFGVRVVLAILGSMAFQGSIKWWCLRHRLHHRFTDDPIHDPYSATRGLFFSHMGWIFYRPLYTRMDLIDKTDLERDPVVTYQHRYYVPLALTFGLATPALIGLLWGDVLGAFIWAGLVARILTWHCTFLVNSLAHWEGLQEFSDEMSARGNFIMALWTCGEANHNFHVFPYDFRCGPALLDWDPSKWLINFLCHLKLADQLRRAPDDDIQFAMDYMKHKHYSQHRHGQDSVPIDEEDAQTWNGQVWEPAEVQKYVEGNKKLCFLVVDDFLLDVTSFLKDHPGGARILGKYSLRGIGEGFIWQDATWAFRNFNNHSLIARRRLQKLRVAKVTYV